jgi:hypothetical protein
VRAGFEQLPPPERPTNRLYHGVVDVLARNPEGAGQLVGNALTYADLSLFPSRAWSILFREGCGELSERFRAWRLCIKRSRNVRAFAPISRAIAASHSTSKGYSVTILSSMGKAAPQIDGIGRRICSRRSRKTLCPLMIDLKPASSPQARMEASTAARPVSKIAVHPRSETGA